MFTAAVITVSDKGFSGERADTGGPLVCRLLEDAGYHVAYRSIVPDEQALIEAELLRTADELGVALTVTTGGTGFSPRDITPEATLAVCQRLVPGIPQAMLMEGLKKTGRAMLSRAQAGIRARTLIVNLPGSPRAIEENLAVILPPLAHGLGVLRGEAQNCGRA